LVVALALAVSELVQALVLPPEQITPSRLVAAGQQEQSLRKYEGQAAATLYFLR